MTPPVGPETAGLSEARLAEIDRIADEIGRSSVPITQAAYVALRAQGYRVGVCRGWDAARAALLAYLALPAAERVTTQEPARGCNRHVTPRVEAAYAGLQTRETSNG